LNFTQPALALRHPATLLATWGGSGLFAFAPGTMGSLATLPFVWGIELGFGKIGVLVFAFITFAIGWWATARYTQHSENKDPKEVVIDEVSGQALVLLLVPQTLLGYALGFVLFRLFDILKPWPVSWADRRFKTPFGVMLDDTLAAFYGLAALVVLQAV
jgi:phosphatidylglycerophosphatase A